VPWSGIAVSYCLPLKILKLQTQLTLQVQHTNNPYTKGNPPVVIYHNFEGDTTMLNKGFH
jgi:hypothetical protein